MRLSGTYQLVKSQIPLFFIGPNDPPPIESFITFMPDGTFIDGGVLDPGNQSYLLTMTHGRFRNGSGTYRLRNHTISLQYRDGRSRRLNFHVRSTSRGEPNLKKLYIQGFRFFQAEPLPFDRLPQLEFPQDWKSLRDPSVTGIFFVPPNVPRGYEATTFVGNSQPLPKPEVARFPGRLHDGGVEGALKSMSSKWQTERGMTREPLGQIPSSTGIFILPDGKRLWMTIFTMVSVAEWQTITVMSTREDLHTSQLTTVKGMLSDRSPAFSARDKSSSSFTGP